MWKTANGFYVWEFLGSPFCIIYCISFHMFQIHVAAQQCLCLRNSAYRSFQLRSIRSLPSTVRFKSDKSVCARVLRESFE